MNAPPPEDLDRTIPVPLQGPRPTASATTPMGLSRQLVRLYLLLGAGTMAVAAVSLWAQRESHPSAPAVAVLYAVLVLASVLVALLPQPRRDRVAVPALAVLVLFSVLAAGLGARWRGYGIAAPSLLLMPMLVFAMSALAGWRPGLALALYVAGVLAFAQAALPAAGPVPLALLALAHGAALVVGVAAGGALHQRVRRAMAAAERRERRFQRLLALATDLYWETDATHALVAAEAEESRLPGWRAAAQQRQPLLALDALEMAPDRRAAIAADLEAQRPFREVPVAWRRPDGSRRQLVLSGEPRVDARGFRGFWGVARDVSAGHATRVALEASQSRYQQLFLSVPTALVLHVDGLIVEGNPEAARLYGVDSTAALRGRRVTSLFPDEAQRRRLEQRLAQVVALPQGVVMPVTEYRIVVRGRPATLSSTGVRFDLGEQPAVLSILHDITDRVAAEQALKSSQAMLAHLVDSSPDLITLTDLATGEYRMVNRAFEAMSGWRADEAIGRTALELGIWGSDAARARFVEQLRATGRVADLAVPFRHRDGRELTLLVSAAPFTLDGRELLVINARDVTASERERMEKSAILENAGVGIAVTRGGRFVVVNAAFERMLGWPGGSLVGQGGRIVWASDEDYAEVGRLVGPALTRGETVTLERPVRRRDGSTFLARMNAGVVDPSRPTEGGTVWIAEDVTEQRRFEQALARARDDAEAANRAKSSFLANTSHELRTPLNGMLGLARLARDPACPPAERERYLAQIEDSGLTLAGIISDILDLSKIEAGKLLVERAPFDLAQLLRTVHRAHEPAAAARGLVLTLELGEGLGPWVEGDALRVRQIVTNFVANAVKFTAGGRIVLRAVRPQAVGPRLRIECEDTGPGIDPATQQRLFRPFTQADESTTRRFGGTGLGLSICRELATLMGGAVGVDSRPGEGSRFWTELPLPTTAAPGGAVPTVSDTAQLAGMRVLLVEDNAVNMLVASAMLERWGVQVVPAADGSEALRVLDAAPQPFDLVLMDVQMPGLSGYEATRAMRARPAGRAVPIVALTAAALVTEREHALAAGMDDFLTKPIDRDRLLATLVRWRRGRDADAGPVTGW